MNLASNEIKCKCGNNVFIPDSKIALEDNINKKYFSLYYFICTKCRKSLINPVPISNEITIKLLLTKK